MFGSIFRQKIFSLNFSQKKQFWKRYIYLWIYYAVFEELKCEDIERTRKVYEACIKVMESNTISFAKIWLLYAQFNIRQRNLTKARKTLVRLSFCSLSII